jgi:WD40 repeat protein
MRDVRERFAELDDLDAPELWSEVRRRGPRPPINVGPSPMRRAGIAILAFVVAIAGLAFAAEAFRSEGQAPAPATPSVSNGKIAFAQLSGGRWQIKTVNSDGTSATTLTSASGEAFHPAWSPDGHRVLFDLRSGGAAQIWLVNDDGTGLTQLTKGPEWNYLPAWSSDGTKIAFVSGRDGNDEVYVMNADGTDQIRLTNSPDEDLSPSWAPDGSRIAFASNRNGNNEIYAMKADGTDVTKLMDDPTAFDADPAWSPDGKRIAFASDGNDPGVYMMNVDGSDVVQLTHDPSVGPLDPVWSPDGTSIAYTRDVGRANQLGIFVFDLSTGSLGALPGAVGNVCCPSWQPVTVGHARPDPSGSVFPGSWVPRVTGSFPLAGDSQFSSIAYGASSLWVSVADGQSTSGTIVRLSVPHGNEEARVQVPVIPHWEVGGGGLTFADDALWVAGTQVDSGTSARVLRIDSATNQVSDVVTVKGQRAADVTEGGGTLWLLVRGDGSTANVYKVDPTTGTIQATIPLAGTYGRSIDVVGDSVWASVMTASGQADSAIDGANLYRIDARTNSITTLEAISGGSALGSGDGQVWTAGGTELRQLDPGSGNVIGTKEVKNTGDAIAVGDGGVWFLDPNTTRGISRFVPETGQVTATGDDTGGNRLAMTVSPGAAWIVDANGTVLRVQLVPDCPPVHPGAYEPTMMPTSGVAGTTVDLSGRVPMFAEDGAFVKPSGTLQLWWNALDEGLAWTALLPGGPDPSPALPGDVSLVAEIPIPDACTYEASFVAPDVAPGSYPLTLLSADGESATSFGAGLVFDVRS